MKKETRVGPVTNHTPPSRDERKQKFEPERCAGDRNEYSRCRPRSGLHYKDFADPRLACSRQHHTGGCQHEQQGNRNGGVCGLDRDGLGGGEA